MTDNQDYQGIIAQCNDLTTRASEDKFSLGRLLIQAKLAEPERSQRELADDVNLRPEQVSEYISVARMYSHVRRESSWSHHNIARRSGQKHYPADVKMARSYALARLDEAETLHMSVRQFSDYMNGVLLLRRIARGDDWNHLKQDVPELDAYDIILKRARIRRRDD